jgi:hypothetical protein
MASLPQAPYKVARIFTVLVSAGIWFVLLAILGFLFSSALASPLISLVNVQVMVAFTLPMAALLSAHGVLTGMLDGYTRQHFMPPEGVVERKDPKPANPWLLGLLLFPTVGVPVAVIYVLVLQFFYAESGGMTPAWSAAWLACSGWVSSAAAAFFTSGRPFLRELSVPEANRRYPGSSGAYLLLRHALPNGAANLVINAAVALAIFPHREGGAPAALVLGDVFIATFVISMFVIHGARTHAMGDRRWGVMAPTESETSPGALARIGVALGLAVVLLAVAALVYVAAGIGPISLEAFLIVKALVGGFVAGLAAWLGASWGLSNKAP